jgi:centromeric protein E
LKAFRSDYNVAATQFGEPSTARSDCRDQADELSSHVNIPSRTVEENRESPLKSQVLMQVNIICSKFIPSNLFDHLKPKRIDTAGWRN